MLLINAGVNLEMFYGGGAVVYLHNSHYTINIKFNYFIFRNFIILELVDVMNFEK
jgi:hypothetical protein